MKSAREWVNDTLIEPVEARPPASAATGRHLLTIDQVAAFLNVSPKTVRRLMQRGLPSVRVGRLVRFAERDVLRWVEARKEV